MTTVRVANTVPAVGRSIPIATKSALSNLASPSPRNRPTTEPKMPMMRASTITDVRTWRRDAPIVRSVANSRVRCAIVMPSVFAITKLPTKSAMPAKASRKFWRNVEEAVTCPSRLLRLRLAVRACARRRQQRLDLRDQLGAGDAGSSPDADQSSWPSLVKSPAPSGDRTWPSSRRRSSDAAEA